jgi:hypothetical protein
MIDTRDGDDSDRRVITLKHLAKDNTSYTFRIKEKDIGDGIHKSPWGRGQEKRRPLAPPVTATLDPGGVARADCI